MNANTIVTDRFSSADSKALYDLGWPTEPCSTAARVGRAPRAGLRSIGVVVSALLCACAGVVPTVDHFSDRSPSGFADVAPERYCEGEPDVLEFDTSGPRIVRHLLRQGEAGLLEVYCSRVDGAPLALSWLIQGLSDKNRPIWPAVPSPGDAVSWQDGKMPREFALHRPHDDRTVSALAPTHLTGLWRQMAFRKLSTYSVLETNFAWFRFLDRARFEAEFGPLLLDDEALEALEEPDQAAGARLLAPLVGSGPREAFQARRATLPAPTGRLGPDFEALRTLARRWAQACVASTDPTALERELRARLDILDGPRDVKVQLPDCLTRPTTLVASFDSLVAVVTASEGADALGRLGQLDRLTPVGPSDPQAPVRVALRRAAAEALLAEATALAARDAWGAAGRAARALQLLSDDMATIGELPAVPLAKGAARPPPDRDGQRTLEALRLAARDRAAAGLVSLVAPRFPRAGAGVEDAFRPEWVPLVAALNIAEQATPRSGPVISAVVVRAPRVEGTAVKREQLSSRTHTVIEAPAAQPRGGDQPRVARLRAQLADLVRRIDLGRSRVGLSSSVPCAPDRYTSCRADGTVERKSVSPWLFMEVNLELSKLEDERIALEGELAQLLVESNAGASPPAESSPRTMTTVTRTEVLLAPVTARATLSSSINGVVFETTTVEHTAELPPGLREADQGELNNSFEYKIQQAVRALSLRAHRKVLEDTATRLRAANPSDGDWFRVLAGLPVVEAVSE